MKSKANIKAKIKFYNWAKKLGIDLKNFDPENINFEEQNVNHSFKKRKEEVKQRFNYKFANLQDDSLQNYPNIQNLIFEPKK